jgi:hypothetical protein
LTPYGQPRHDRPVSTPDPPLAAWSLDGAMRALEVLARDLPHIDADTARARLPGSLPSSARQSRT